MMLLRRHARRKRAIVLRMLIVVADGIWCGLRILRYCRIWLCLRWLCGKRAPLHYWSLVDHTPRGHRVLVHCGLAFWVTLSGVDRLHTRLIPCRS